MEEGKLSLEDHVAEVFKDKLPSNPDPNLEKIQLKHLLCMSSGFGKALLMNEDRRPGVGAPDYEKYMMAQPVLWSQAVHSAIPLPTVFWLLIW